MREFQERRRLKKFLHSRYAIAILIIIAVLLVRGVWSIYGKYGKSQAIVTRALGDLAALQERERELLLSTAILSTDEGKEREIRDRFGAVKEGERLIVLVDNEEDTENPETPLKKEGFWEKFMSVFGF